MDSFSFTFTPGKGKTKGYSDFAGTAGTSNGPGATAKLPPWAKPSTGRFRKNITDALKSPEDDEDDGSLVAKKAALRRRLMAKKTRK